MPDPRTSEEVTSRTRLFESASGLVERVECRSSQPGLIAEDFSPDSKVAFPYRGGFVWHVGGDAVISDPNQVLFIRGGEPFRVGRHRPDGFGEVIITPAESILRAVSEATGFDLERHPLFAARSRRAPPMLQRRCAQFLHQAVNDDRPTDLDLDDALISLLRDALQLEVPTSVSSPRTRRLIRRAKEFVDAHFTERLRLSDVGRAVGASPAYVTDVFRRFEGISLRRYVTQLRLARALVELPYSTDITSLALDLGFSSHSHFTLAFRRAFGCTPSEFRRITRHRHVSAPGWLLKPAWLGPPGPREHR